MTEVNTDLVKILDDDFQYKHSAYWSLFYKSVFAISTILLFPFVSKDIASNNITILFFFPAFAFIVTIMSTWILFSEKYRLQRAAEMAYEGIEFNVVNSPINSKIESYDEFLRKRHFLANVKIPTVMTVSVFFVGSGVALLEALFFACAN